MTVDNTNRRRIQENNLRVLKSMGLRKRKPDPGCPRCQGPGKLQELPPEVVYNYTHVCEFCHAEIMMALAKEIP